jgi:hypothetical protein
MGLPVKHKNTVSILDTATLSSAIDLRTATLTGVILPSGFNGTTLGFQVSDTEDGTYVALQDGAGSDYGLTVAASKAYALNPSDFVSWQFVKLVVTAQTSDVDVIFYLKEI